METKNRKREGNITQIISQRKRFEKAYKHVTNVMNYGDLEYKDFIFELGMEFIESRFDEREEQLAIAKYPRFWAFFRKQYNELEWEYLKDVMMIHIFTGRASKLNYEKHMRFILKCERTNSAFIQLISRLPNKG
jgi:hypothetical protein